jgi:hypothetical protein
VVCAAAVRAGRVGAVGAGAVQGGGGYGSVKLAASGRR